MPHLNTSSLAGFLMVLSLLVAPISGPAQSQERAIPVEAILNDPEAPVGGNPKGDITIVTFTDYNCPFCKKGAADLEHLVRTDGNIRLVYKDWPVITPSSLHGAQLALAAKYQGKYELVHHALMAAPGRKIGKDKMSEAVKASGVDVDRLNQDRRRHNGEITALLRRNMEQADALGLQGTPVYLIGPLKVAAALNYEQLKEVVADARARAKP
ncbi:MAG: disulfide bond formation protein DsbA [Microvirga sp.]|jgi:protein-disulfide isomerase|nr:disulfide bond formation protein DsbA [Microvirga sp.]